MSSKEVLFVRNNENDTDEDLWNDDVLISLYDKALKVAKKEVAQRIAMETNNKVKEKTSSKLCLEGNESNTSSQCNVSHKNVKKTSREWKQGDNCRAIYTEDGLEYEAIIKKMLDNEMCIVTYLGYGNEEIQSLSEILPSKGKSEIMKQTYSAMSDGNEDSSSTSKLGEETDEPMEEAAYHEISSTSKKMSKPSVKNSRPAFPAGFPLPNIPNFSPSMGMESGFPPPPPMPFLSPDNASLCEDKTLYPMLVSWYMSGYYTGLFQGQKMQKKTGNSK